MLTARRRMIVGQNFFYDILQFRIYSYVKDYAPGTNTNPVHTSTDIYEGIIQAPFPLEKFVGPNMYKIVFSLSKSGLGMEAYIINNNQEKQRIKGIYKHIFKETGENGDDLPTVITHYEVIPPKGGTLNFDNYGQPASELNIPTYDQDKLIKKRKISNEDIFYYSVIPLMPGKVEYKSTREYIPESGESVPSSQIRTNACPRCGEKEDIHLELRDQTLVCPGCGKTTSAHWYKCGKCGHTYVPATEICDNTTDPELGRHYIC